jgi:hypothetical protein
MSTSVSETRVKSRLETRMLHVCCRTCFPCWEDLEIQPSSNRPGELLESDG